MGWGVDVLACASEEEGAEPKIFRILRGAGIQNFTCDQIRFFEVSVWGVYNPSHTVSRFSGLAGHLRFPLEGP